MRVYYPSIMVKQSLKSLERKKMNKIQFLKSSRQISVNISTTKKSLRFLQNDIHLVQTSVSQEHLYLSFFCVSDIHE